MSQRKAKQARQAQQQAASPPSLWARHRNLLLGAAAALVVALVAAGAVIARDTGPAQAINVSTAGGAIELSGTDPVTGEAVSLASYAGTPVVLNIWGSWCHGCIEEAEDLREFTAAHPEVQMIGIDLQDTKSAAKEFYEEWRWTHPSVFDPDGAISFRLGLQGTPTTFFLDENHRIVTQIVGATDRAGFEQGLQAALAAS
jgi:thiol-disulfide isomerase/thioredoxin